MFLLEELVSEEICPLPIKTLSEKEWQLPNIFSFKKQLGTRTAPSGFINEPCYLFDFV